MIPELLKYLCVKDNYYAARSLIPRESLPKEAKEFFDFLDEYFKVYESSDSEVDFVKFRTAYKFVNHGEMSDLMEMQISAVEAADIKESGVVQRVIDKETAFDIREVTEKILDDDSKFTMVNINELLLDHESKSVLLENQDHDLSDESFEDALSNIHRSGYSWPLNLLNELLGPLNNEFIIVGARPDGGKTAMLLHCAWHIASQMKEGEKVLWFNNEEHIRMIKMRLLQSISALTKDDLLDNIVDVIKRIKEEIFDFEKRIIFVDNANDIRQIQKAVRQHKPSLVIIDQLFKVRGAVSGKDGNEAERYRRICEWARNVAKHNCPVIVSSQLDFNAEGERYPTMDSLYMSKTGAQGEADAILLIGSVKSEPDKRFIYTPKNKLTGSVKEKEAYLLKNVTRFKDV